MSSMPIGFGASTHEVLQCAYHSYSVDYDASRERAADELEPVRQHDVPGMVRAIAIRH
jgi:hypothetical protein